MHNITSLRNLFFLSFTKLKSNTMLFAIRNLKYLGNLTLSIVSSKFCCYYLVELPIKLNILHLRWMTLLVYVPNEERLIGLMYISFCSTIIVEKLPNLDLYIDWTILPFPYIASISALAENASNSLKHLELL